MGRVQQFKANLALVCGVAALAFGVAAYARTPTSDVAARSSTIPYEGFLEQDGFPVNGPQDIAFELYDSADGTVRVWGPETHIAVPVNAGRFSVSLGDTQDMVDAALAGNRWLKVTVAGTALAGLQLLGSAPFARRGAPGQDFQVDGDATVGGAIAATNVSGTNTGDEPAASTTVPGVIEIATNAEVQAGDAVRAVTGASLAACTATTTRAGVAQTATNAEARAGASTTTVLTPANLSALRFESSDQTIPDGTTLSVAHGLGAVPSISSCSYVCTTAEFGFAVGDEIPVTTMMQSTSHRLTFWADATHLNVFIADSTGNRFMVACPDGADHRLTTANWRIKFRALL